MEKEEIGGESIIDGRRNRLDIGKELDKIGDAIKKEVRSFELQENKLNQLETNDRAKRTQKSILLINHINRMRMRKLHKQQTLLYDEYLKYKLIK
jgi:hypothetical protein